LAGTFTASKTRAEVKERARVSILVLMGSSIGVPVLVDIFTESHRFLRFWCCMDRTTVGRWRDGLFDRPAADGAETRSSRTHSAVGVGPDPEMTWAEHLRGVVDVDAPECPGAARDFG
jgi:hypothetical protein